MSIPVFLSVPQPHLNMQRDFLKALCKQLEERRLAPRTLGVSDFTNDVPLRTVRSLMLECCGVIVIGLRRHWINDGETNHKSNLSDRPARMIREQWMTSPWCQIEAAMGFQLGLPVLILREEGVMEEGVFERGVGDFFLPVFKLIDGIDDLFLSTEEWRQVFNDWDSKVRAVRRNRGMPERYW